MNKPKSKPVDKTKLFKALEAELMESGIKAVDLDDEIEESISDLAEFFEDAARLRMFANLGGLNFEHSFLRQRKDQPWIANSVRALLTEFRQAIRADQDGFLKNWRVWNDDTSKAVWGTETSLNILLHQDSDALEVAGMVKLYFREVGEFLEGSLQKFLRARLGLWEFVGKRSSGARPIAGMSFGEVAAELVGNGPDMYRLEPFNLPVSQWRNVAQHNSFEVKDDGVIQVSYGAAGRQKLLDLTVKDVEKVLRYCNDLCYVHKIARDFFFFDNLEQLKLVSFPQAAPANEAAYHHSLVCNLAYRIVSSGFTFLHATMDNKGWIFNLIDRLDREKADVKAALQEASFPYTLGQGLTEYRALVLSKGRMLKISFESLIVKDGEDSPERFREPARTLDRSFNLKR